jgi:hypothetical protein
VSQADFSHDQNSIRVRLELKGLENLRYLNYEDLGEEAKEEEMASQYWVSYSFYGEEVICEKKSIRKGEMSAEKGTGCISLEIEDMFQLSIGQEAIEKLMKGIRVKLFEQRPVKRYE